MRMSTAVVALAFLLAITTVTTTVNADYFGVCVFQDTYASGYITFQQVESGGDMAIVTNFTTYEQTGSLYLHFHTYGDVNMDEAGVENECWTTTTLGPFKADGSNNTFLTTTWTSGLELYGSESIIGRGLALYSRSSCAKGLNSDAIGQCVIGIRNVAYAANNTAGLYLTSEPTSAYARFTATSGNTGITGEIFFVPLADGDIYTYLHVSGLTTNANHAIHVHLWGDITGTDGLKAGLHLNPLNGIHGLPPSLTRHMGDMGNITTDSDGAVTQEMTFNLMSMTNSAGNILGRTIIVHQLGDDGNPTNSTTSTGSAGTRLCRGVIGVTTRLPSTYSASTTTTAAAASEKHMKRATRARLNKLKMRAAHRRQVVVVPAPALAEAAPAQAALSPASAPPTPKKKVVLQPL